VSKEKKKTNLLETSGEGPWYKKRRERGVSRSDILTLSKNDKPPEREKEKKKSAKKDRHGSSQKS